jgi:epoxyqueuosine reductase QueG
MEKSSTMVRQEIFSSDKKFEKQEDPQKKIFIPLPQVSEQSIEASISISPMSKNNNNRMIKPSIDNVGEVLRREI